MGTPYEKDVVAWAMDQAALLRAGKLSALDIEHIAEEIEALCKLFRCSVGELLEHVHEGTPTRPYPTERGPA